MTPHNMHQISVEEFPAGIELLHSLQGHKGTIYSLAWSPGGKILATGGTDNSIRLWDHEQGELFRKLKHKSLFSTVTWSPDGEFLVSGLWNHTIHIWDVRTGSLHCLLKHNRVVSSLAWAPDGRMFATGTGDRLVYLWNAQRGELLQTLEGHDDGITSLDWSPNGLMLASGSDDQTIRVWDMQHRELLHFLEDKHGGVISLQWSPDGRSLVSGSFDETVELWEPQSGTLLHAIDGAYGTPDTIAWSSDGHMLAIGKWDQTIHVFDVKEQQDVQILSDCPCWIRCLRFSSNGRLLAAKTEGAVFLWRCDTWELAAMLYEPGSLIFGGLTFHPTRSVLATCEGKENSIRIWQLDYERLFQTDIDQDQQIAPKDEKSEEQSRQEDQNSFSPSLVGGVRGGGSELNIESGQQPREPESEESSSQTKENVPSGFHLLQTLQDFKGTVCCETAWSPDGKRLAEASADHTIHLWDPYKGELLSTLKGHDDSVYEVAWSPDGQVLASGSTDRTVCIWDGHSGELLQALEGHTSDVGSLAWSPDGTMLASGSRDQTIRMWDSQNGEIMRVLEGHRGPIYDLDWSPDGDHLASASFDKTIRIWDVRQGTCSRKLEGHGGAVTSVAWSPDGQTIAAGFLDNTIHLWDAASGRQEGILESHTDIILCIRFSPDGQLLVSKSYDGTVRLWRCDTWNVVAVLPERANILIFGGLAFHPQEHMLVSLGEEEGILRVWRLDYNVLLSVEARSDVRYYRNAKVVLMGDTGVGKSGLALVLSGRPFQPTESTHGRRVWLFGSEEKELPHNQRETRETLIWDLAGQPGYRLVHQLHLSEVVVALSIFDARSERECLEGVQYWDRALQQAYRLHGDTTWPLKKFLVVARSDRGGVPITPKRIDALIERLGFDGFFETSAREGWHIQELITAIQESIDWNALPKVSSNELFQTIKQFLVHEKQAGRMLSNAEELYYLFYRTHPNLTDVPDLRAKFDTCIGRVESRGLIRRLSFGNYVLLQPELLDSYASGMINTAKGEIDGRGFIFEEDALHCRFKMPADERVADTHQ